VQAPQARLRERVHQPNSSAAVVETAHFVAAQRGVEAAELEATLEHTAAELFGW
jgi:Tat protein secretion system quality control protein TatD with DNase activity